MHAPQIADELGIDRIVIPRWPGITAALGLLAADVRHDLARGFVLPPGADTATALEAVLAELEAEVAAAARRQPRALHWSLDVRYRGQAYELTVPLPPRPATDATLARAMRGFHAAHRRAYGHATPGAPTEIVTVRCRATVAQPGAARSRAPPPTPRPAGSRTVQGVRHAVHRPRGARRATRTSPGPAIVEQEDSTLLVPAGWTLRGAPRRHPAPGARMNRPGHAGDPERRVLVDRRGDGGGRVPLVVLADHPRDARLLVRHVRRRRAPDRALRDDPGAARADAVVAAAGAREAPSGRPPARAT